MDIGQQNLAASITEAHRDYIPHASYKSIKKCQLINNNLQMLFEHCMHACMPAEP